MVLNEFIKLVTNRIFIVCMLSVLIANGIIIYIFNEKSAKADEVSAKSYRELVRDISDKDNDEKYKYLDEQLEFLQNIFMTLIYVQGGMHDDFSVSEIDDDEIDEYVELVKTGAYLKYTKNLFAETALYSELLDEVKQCVEYENTVNTILQNTEKSLNKSNEGSFERRRLENIKTIYSELSYVRPQHSASRGINLLLDNNVSDLLAAAAVFLVCIMLVCYEREKNLTSLSKATFRGRAAHGAVKAAAVFAGVFLIVLAVYAENIGVSALMYGLGDLSRPIQSVYGMQRCILNVSVGGFIGIYFLCKLLFFGMCGGFFYLVCVAVRRSAAVYLISAAFVGALVFAYNKIDVKSYLVMWKYFNPVSYGKIIPQLMTYTAVNIGGIPVNLNTLSLVLSAFMLLICFAAATAVYACMVEKETGHIQEPVLDRRACFHTNVFLHEAYKVFISRYVLLVLIFGGAAAYLTYAPAAYNAQTINDVYFKYYAQMFEGDYDDAKAEGINSTLELVNLSMEEPDISSNKYLALESAASALNRLKGHGDYLAGLEHGVLFWDEGYLKYTGGDDDVNQRNMLMLLICSVFTVISLCAVMSVDSSGREYMMIRCTLKGRNSYIRNKIIIGLIIIIAMLLAYFLPSFISTLRLYGTEYMGAAAKNMEHLKWLPERVTIGMYIALRYLALFAVSLAVMALCYIISFKQRSYAVSILICGAIVIIPLGIMII